MPTSLLSWSKVQEFAPWRLLSVLFFEPIRYFFSSFANLALISFSALLLALAAHASFPWRKRVQTPQDTFFFALIWFPLLSLCLMAFFSYISLPLYVFYFFAVGAPFGLLFATESIDTQVSEREKIQAQKFWIFLGFLFSLVCVFTVIKPHSVLYEKLGKSVARFAENNEGVYAMSTGAGVSAFLSEKPFVRLDGLASNKEMLDFISVQKAMDLTFKTFKVDYYIALNPIKSQSCFSAREPVQNRFAGSNKGMSDWLCAEPVFEEQITPKTKMLIFKINEEGKAFEIYPKK